MTILNSSGYRSINFDFYYKVARIMTYSITNALGMASYDVISYTLALVFSLYTQIHLKSSRVMRAPPSAGYRSITCDFYYHMIEQRVL